MSELTPALRNYMHAVCAILEREGHEKHLAVPEAEAVIDGEAKGTDAATTALAIIISRGMRKAAYPGMRALIEQAARDRDFLRGRGIIK